MKINHLIAATLLVFMPVSCSSAGRKVASSAAETGRETVGSDAAKTGDTGTVHLTRDDFMTKVANIEKNPDRWVYLGDKPCIVDFYADWCGPCKMIAPILEELAAEYGGEIRIYKVDLERERKLAAEFGIRSIPSLLFCPLNGDPQMIRGAMPKEEFKKAIDSVLLKKP
ncbi:MAG: thioredoxin [Proteiniphilum sp.]|jgi:thioredoxin|nr:thioredoxin [Proteiniphilum sp.]